MAMNANQANFLPTMPSASPARPRTLQRANDLDGAAWLRNSISVWDDIRKTSEEVALKHPAIFPAQLVTRLIESFTNAEQQIVLDPFAGIGSTVVAAEALGKIGIGLDVSPKFIHKAQARPRQILSNGGAQGERRLHIANASDLLDYVSPESVDLVVTSPPYWDILLQNRTADYKEIRHYGEEQHDIGHIGDYDEFLDKLTDIFGKVLIAMKPGTYCCVVVMDLRKKDKFYPFHADLANKLTDVGYLFDDLIIWVRSHEYNNLRPLGYPSVFRINKTHEYIVILQKPR